MVLCCICGVDIRDHGYGARCAQCLQKEVDITEGVSRRLIVQRCGTCGRWLKQGGQYVAADMESRELLSVCLKHVKGLSKERTLVDAGFIWTEPHSKEIKVKLVLQQEVMGGLVVQQTMVVDFRIQNLQCAGCTKLYTRHFWESNVQVRQRSAGNRRTLEALEQLIIKHNAHTNLIKCEATKEGLDFFFRSERDSQSFVGFIKSWAVVRFHDSKHLVSHDTHNTTYRFKKTTFIELCPICRDDLVLLPPKAAQALGGVPPLMLCTRSVSVVGLVEPASGRSIEVTSMDYWKRPFTTVCGAKQLTEFVVLDVLPLEEGGGQQPAHRGRSDARTVSMCEVEIARVSDFGQNEERAIVRCHLGHTLHVSDIVLGYDLRTLNHGLDEELWSELPLDIYLVKKQKVKQKKPMSSKAKKQSGKSGSRAASTREAEDDKTDVASVQDEDDEEAQEDKELSTAAAQMLDGLGREEEGEGQGQEAEEQAAASGNDAFAPPARVRAASPSAAGEEGGGAAAAGNGTGGARSRAAKKQQAQGRSTGGAAAVAADSDGSPESGAEGESAALAKGRTRKKKAGGGRRAKREQQES